MHPTVAPADARTLFLHAQCLLDDPARRATTASVAKLIARLGYVQLDSISRVERAHHLILGARLDGYRPALLDRLAFDERWLFEHRTHDAAYIPVQLFPARGNIISVRKTLKRQVSGNGKRSALHGLPESFHDLHPSLP
jgi:hypothetical protein